MYLLLLSTYNILRGVQKCLQLYMRKETDDIEIVAIVQTITLCQFINCCIRNMCKFHYIRKQSVSLNFSIHQNSEFSRRHNRLNQCLVAN